MQFPILLPNIFNYPFTYESNLNLSVGDFVEVPFGTSKKIGCLLYTSPSPRDQRGSRMPSSA